ncbi:MAG: hypothetical protein IJN78_00520 [Clostridia bacterium]|nr:hypothetical protein [Clostridia bacterium]
MYNKHSKKSEHSLLNEEKRKNRKNNDDIRTVANSKWFLTTGIIGIVFCLYLGIFGLIKISDKISIVFFCVFVLFSLLFVSLVIGFINCRIYYDDDGFVYKNFFGKKQRYLYTEIDCIHYRRKGDYGIKVNDKEISIEALAIGSSTFILFAKEKCRQLNGGRDVPDFSPKAKLDLFKGNIKNPETYVVVYSLLLVLVMILVAVMVIPSETTQMSELIFVEAPISDYEVNNDDLIVRIEGVKRELYLYGYNQTVTGIENLYSVFDNKEQLKIGYSHSSARYGNKKTIEYIEDSKGTVYTTPEDYNRYYREFLEQKNDLVGTFLVLIVSLYIVLAFYVGRHPQKFNKRFVNLFYKGNLVDKKEK